MKDAISIQISPIEKVRFKSKDRDPFVMIKTTPAMTRKIPSTFRVVIDSFKKNRDKIKIKIGKVMAIRDKLVAVVVRPAM